MNANRTRFRTRASGVLLTIAALSGCVEAPQQPRAPAPRPAPLRPTPSPPPSASQPMDWRDAPATPGDWNWSSDGSAQFGGGLFTLRCAARGQILVIQRAGTAPSPVPMTITTTAFSRTLTATPAGNAMTVSLNPRDPLLDAMAFSRGRFAVEVAGMAPLYIPAWPEMARVIEECR